MLIENKSIEKICSFYVSDFHLEMILMPYINKELEENKNIIIKTEKNLKDTVEILVSKMNLNDENKERILNLDWNNEFNKKANNNSDVIVIGSEKYINDINSEIKNENIENVKIIDCYNFNDVKDNMNKIIEFHDKSLNTMGIQKVQINSKI